MRGFLEPQHGLRHLADLVLLAQRRHLDRLVAGGETPHDVRHAPDGPGDQAGQQDAHGDADQRGGDAAGDQGRVRRADRARLLVAPLVHEIDLGIDDLRLEAARLVEPDRARQRARLVAGHRVAEQRDLLVGLLALPLAEGGHQGVGARLLRGQRRLRLEGADRVGEGLLLLLVDPGERVLAGHHVGAHGVLLLDHQGEHLLRQDREVGADLVALRHGPDALQVHGHDRGRSDKGKHKHAECEHELPGNRHVLHVGAPRHAAGHTRQPTGVSRGEIRTLDSCR